MVLRTYTSTKHHIILISKQKLRIYTLITLVIFSIFFLIQMTRLLSFPVTPTSIVNSALFFRRVQVVEVVNNNNNNNKNKGEPARQEARQPDQELSSPSTLFPSSRLEIETCTEAKASGRCMFEARHLPPHFSLFETLLSSPAKNWTRKSWKRLKIATKFYGKMSNQIALIVTFNKATNYEVIPLLEAFYRSIFVKIVFCGPSTSKEQFRLVLERFYGTDAANLMGPLFLSYKPDLPDLGENVYTCFNLAISSQRLLGDLVERNVLAGVFVMADDVLLNYWNFFTPLLSETGDVYYDKITANTSNSSSNSFSSVFDFDKSYAMPVGIIYDAESLNACPVNSPGPCVTPNPWPNWPKMFQPETVNFYRELEELAERNGSMRLFSDCLKNLITRTGGRHRVLQSPSDFFYISRQHFTTTVGMFELANQHKIFQEVAIQTTFACFDEATRRQLNSAGDNTDGVNRKMPWAGYRAEWLFMHPFKLSLIATQDWRLRDFYLPDRCLFCMLAEFSKQFRYNLVQSLERVGS